MSEEQTSSTETTQVDDQKTQETSTENKETSTENKETSTEQTQKKVVPEKYDLKLPDGSPLTGLLEKTVATYKAQGFSQEEAQKAAERDHGLLSAYADAQKQQQEKLISDEKEKWQKNAKEDKEFGGDAFPQSVELAKRVVQRFFTPQFVEDLEKTGFGNYPELIRGLVRIGKSMSEDQLVAPGSQTGGKKSLEDVFYGGDKK